MGAGSGLYGGGSFGGQPGGASSIGGFSRSQCIEIANRRTEKRGISLDLEGEFILALQEVCMETRWWWRRKTAIGTFTAGAASFDLTDSSAWNAPDFHQAAKDAVRLYTPSGAGQPVGTGTWQSRSVEPEFSPEEQDKILALRRYWTPGTPCRYFVQWPMLQLDVITDQAYPASIGYWAIPNFTDDSEDEVIPLVPNYAQGLVIKRLEIHIERFALGEENEKYKAVSGEYGEMVAKQHIFNRFADGQVQEIRNMVCGDAVQSS